MPLEVRWLNLFSGLNKMYITDYMNINKLNASGRGAIPRGWGVQILLAMLLVISGSCKQQTESEVRNVILDVDTSVDDIMSILYLLQDPGITIRAITISNGVAPADSGLEIVLRLLNLTGHTDIPVALGALHPLKGNNAFPLQWQPSVSNPFGLNLPPHASKASNDSAGSIIIKMIEKYLTKMK